MTQKSTVDWNPNWLAFLEEEDLSVDEVEKYDKPKRIILNAKFMNRNLARSNFLGERKSWT